jgi:quercetin dioxygenase-like cupin family protein
MTTIANNSALLSLVETIAGLRAESDGPANLAAVESTLRRGQMPPLHAHDTDEVFYVLEGTMVVHTGDESVPLDAGDAFVARRELPHTHEAGSATVRYLSMTFTRSPARYEDFLRAVAPPGSPNADEVAALAGIARANGITVLGPPGALPAG